ncbi:MAG: TolC family protein, partial [Planctomycetota bacterium]
MHYHGTVRPTMAVRLGISIIIPLLLVGVPRAVRSEPPTEGPASPTVERLPPVTGDYSRPAGGRLKPATDMPRPPLGAAESHGTEEFAGLPGRQETLEGAWVRALAADQRLEARRWEVSSAEQSLQSARARRWPTVAVDGSYTVRSDEPAFRFGAAGVPLPTDVFPFAQDENFAFRTKVNLPLYTSGRILHGIAAAADNVTSAELKVEDSTNDLKLRVAEEYVEVLRAQRDVEVTRCNVRSLESHARDVELLFRHGQVPRNDLLAAQVALSNARQRAIQARNRLDAGRAAYNRRLGRSLT